MSFIPEDVLSGLGFGYSIAGIVLVVPICFIFREYFKFLDNLQLFFLFYLALGKNKVMFSHYLSASWVDFDRNFYVFCTQGDLVCTAGFPLSFTSCLIVFLLIMLIVVAIEQCKKPELRFEPVYNFFKGFIRWTYLPLSYYSLYFMILSIQGKKNNLIESIVIFAICFLFPFLQLIGYKCIQKNSDNFWKKWLQLFSFLKILFMGVLIACAKLMQSESPYYFIYAVYLVYDFLYLWKCIFIFPILGRIFFFTEEVLSVCVSFFFLFKLNLLTDYSLDFFFVSIILLMDLGHYIAQGIYVSKYGVPKENRKIIPDKSVVSEHDQKKREVIQIQSFEEEQKKNEETYEELNPNSTDFNRYKIKSRR